MFHFVIFRTQCLNHLVNSFPIDVFIFTVLDKNLLFSHKRTLVPGSRVSCSLQGYKGVSLQPRE